MADLIGAPSSSRRRLRELLNAPEPLVAPGSYDALSARLVEAAGFNAVYMSGYGTTASLLGRPDVGLLGQAEMTDNLRRIVQAVNLPVIADADTGYGSALNVIRAVREYEQAGAAGLHIEDQVTPKKCGHMAGKSVIPTADMVGKIRAAVAARQDPDLVLIARTDAAAVEGLDAALERAHRYHAAGADLLFVEALTSEAEIVTAVDRLAGVPLMFNWAEGGQTPKLSLSRITEMGFRLVIFPSSAVYAATAGIRQILSVIASEGTPASAMANLSSFDEFNEFIGLIEAETLQDRFGPATGTHSSELGAK